MTDETNAPDMRQWKMTPRQPGLIVFLLDQSASMHLAYTPGGVSCAVVAAQIVNHTLGLLVDRAGRDPKSDAARSICDITVWAYSDITWPMAPFGALPMDISYLADHFERVDSVPGSAALSGTRTPRIAETTRMWTRAEYSGAGSNLAQAIQNATRLVSNWLDASPVRLYGVPPLVINISDGECDRFNSPAQALSTLSALETQLGRLVVMSVSVSSSPQMRIFPPDIDDLTTNEVFLWQMSGQMPMAICQRMKLWYDASAKNPAWLARLASATSLPQLFLAHPDARIIAEIIAAMLA